MDAIQFPDVQSEDIDTVIPALQHTIAQAVQVGSICTPVVTFSILVKHFRFYKQAQSCTTQHIIVMCMTEQTILDSMTTPVTIM